MSRFIGQIGRLLHSRLMPPSSLNSALWRYALLGAHARLRELAEETANIYRTFPQLRGAASAITSRPESNEPTKRRQRGRMSAAQRKAVGERMKRYWAARRAAANRTKTESQTTSAAKASPKRRRGRRAKVSAKRGARKMSAAARKRISDAQKARWAKRKAAA